MKSSATPSQHQRQRSMGNIHHLMPLPTPHGAFNRMSLTSDAISTVGLNNDGSSSGDPLAGSSGPTGGASISGLHDAKRAIDHLKSVTGIVYYTLSIWKLLRYYAILAQLLPIEWAADYVAPLLLIYDPLNRKKWRSQLLHIFFFFLLMLIMFNRSFSHSK